MPNEPVKPTMANVSVTSEQSLLLVLVERTEKAAGSTRTGQACRRVRRRRKYMDDIDDNEFMAPFTIQGPWKVVVNPETAASKFPMTPMLVGVREDGLAIYSHCEPYVDKYYMGWTDKIPVTVVGCPPFGQVIRMADEQWPFQEAGSGDA
jgi:hypothetical protein